MKQLIARTLATAVVAGLAIAVVGAQSGSATKQAPPAKTAMKSAAPKMTPVDINSATREQLTAIAGIDAATADKIIAGRPYKTKAELSTRKPAIVSAAVYKKISGMIIAKQAK